MNRRRSALSSATTWIALILFVGAWAAQALHPAFCPEEVGAAAPAEASSCAAAGAEASPVHHPDGVATHEDAAVGAPDCAFCGLAPERALRPAEPAAIVAVAPRDPVARGRVDGVVPDRSALFDFASRAPPVA